MSAKTSLSTLSLLIALLILASSLPAQSLGLSSGRSVLVGSHGDKSLVPGSCRACHRGMRMLIDGEESTCLSCHSSDQARTEMERRGLLGHTRNVLADMSVEVAKPYAHPVLNVKGVHRSYEALPEESPNVPRHSECVDCHKAHVLTKEKPFRGFAGRRVGNFIAQIEEEYELCYRCHAESANLPVGSTNKSVEFDKSNPSFHPVEGEGRSSYVISLIEPYVARAKKKDEISQIMCSDCHGNDDPDGPSGPHGSIYEGILKDRYEMEDGLDETVFTYALCYRCHDRNSILANESFRYHSLHILGSGDALNPGTSCFTCHDAHGSTENPYLIRFNPEVVFPTVDEILEYKAEGVETRRGSCSLVCHEVEHNPKSY